MGFPAFRRLVHTPGGHTGPTLQSLPCPLRGLIRVTCCARVRDLVLIRHFRCDEIKRMAANIDVGNRHFNFRHVARDTLTARAPRLMVSVGLDRWSVWPILGSGSMAGQAHLRSRSPEICVVVSAVHIVTTEAGHTTPIHQALHKVISLHPVLMARAIREMCKRGFSQLVFLKFPEVFKV